MNLNNILNDLNKYKHTDKEELLCSYIQDRLNASINTYYNELSHSLDYLYNKDDLRLIRKMNRL